MLSPLQPRWSGRGTRLGLLSVHPHVPGRCQVVHVVLACSCGLIRSLLVSESFGSDPCCAILLFSVPLRLSPRDICACRMCFACTRCSQERQWLVWGHYCLSKWYGQEKGWPICSHFVPWLPTEELLEAGRGFLLCAQAGIGFAQIIACTDWLYCEFVVMPVRWW